MKEKETEYLECERCGKKTEDVCVRQNGYAADVYNDPTVFFQVCDECNYQNNMDI